MVIVRVRQHDELAEVVTGRIAAVSGIVETRTMIAFKAYSRHDIESMFSLGADCSAVTRSLRAAVTR